MTLPNPVTIVLNSPNGPKIIYPRNSDGDDVELWCPKGWAIDWETTPAQCGIGYVASPLIRTEQPSPTAAEADIVAAIDQSRMQNAIIHIEWSAERESELLGHAEDHAEASPTVLEAWGTDDGGTEWRVHLDGHRG